MTEGTTVRLGVADPDDGWLRGTVEPRRFSTVPGPDQPPLVVEAHGIVRRFDEKVALDGVSLTIRAGTMHGLPGPNGTGKTTLMRILTGLVEADSGKVVIAGCDPALNTRTLRARVGLVPSGDRSLYLRLSGIENLLFFARLQGIRRRAALARATEVIELVGLTDAARVPVGVYSHGMQKRLSVTRGLITDPPCFSWTKRLTTWIPRRQRTSEPSCARLLPGVRRSSGRRNVSMRCAASPTA